MENDWEIMEFENVFGNFIFGGDSKQKLDGNKRNNYIYSRHYYIKLEIAKY